MKGNASNVFRIWCMVKEGIVTDEDGKQWKQVSVLEYMRDCHWFLLQGPSSVHRWNWSCGSNPRENCHRRYRRRTYWLRGQNQADIQGRKQFSHAFWSSLADEEVQMCCEACPSRDEIFMFGYSRGACQCIPDKLPAQLTVPKSYWDRSLVSCIICKLWSQIFLISMSSFWRVFESIVLLRQNLSSWKTLWVPSNQWGTSNWHLPQVFRHL